jgi:hypothetical protein
VEISEAAAREAVGEAVSEAVEEAEAAAEGAAEVGAEEAEVEVVVASSANGAQTGDLMVLVWLKMAKMKSKNLGPVVLTIGLYSFVANKSFPIQREWIWIRCLRCGRRNAPRCIRRRRRPRSSSTPVYGTDAEIPRFKCAKRQEEKDCT